MSDAEQRPERNRLSTLQYAVTREGVTEPAFSGDYVYHTASGSYRCVCCDAVLFHSGAKYDSGSGWPSFREPVNQTALCVVDDSSLRVRRTEVRCTRCDAHLGHVFDDGSQPTGQRYCINSASLRFSAETS